MTDQKLCGEHVYWWDGEYECECERPDGHSGPHFDGMSWFNDDNEETQEPDIAEFVRARFAERELMLRTVSPARMAWATFQYPDGSMRYTSVVSANGAVWVCDGHVVEPDSVQVVFDRAQELAKVAADRKILDWAFDGAEDGLVSAERSIEGEWGSAPGLVDRLLRLLASAYAGHPDYWKGWKP